MESHTNYEISKSYSKYIQIYSVNPLYLLFKRVNGYFEEIKGNKYVKLVLNNKGKEKKYIYELICGNCEVESKT